MRPPDSERALAQPEPPRPSLHTVQRSAVVAIIPAAAALFIAGLRSPTISSAVGVSVEQGVLAVSVFLGAVIVATAAYYRFGATSRIYLSCDYAESFALSWAIAYLIQASSGVHSFFWLFYGVQIIATALAGFSFIYLAAVGAGPIYLIASFLWRGDAAAAWLSALAGICGLFVYLVIARISNQRDAALKREAALRQELGRILVARERARISRDLHDNVATELTALVWRVREIAGAAPIEERTLDMGDVAERLRSVIADLRNVVLALREPELGFPELKLILERRCRELCGPTELRLTVSGELETEELGAFRDDVLPICFELVSNAARHAHASMIEVVLTLGVELRLLVRDDGGGLPPNAWQDSRGGLLGSRDRVQRLGGDLTLIPPSKKVPGTTLTIELPRPLRESGGETRPGPELKAG